MDFSLLPNYIIITIYYNDVIDKMCLTMSFIVAFNDNNKKDFF